MAFQEISHGKQAQDGLWLHICKQALGTHQQHSTPWLNSPGDPRYKYSREDDDAGDLSHPILTAHKPPSDFATYHSETG